MHRSLIVLSVCLWFCTLPSILCQSVALEDAGELLDNVAERISNNISDFGTVLDKDSDDSYLDDESSTLESETEKGRSIFDVTWGMEAETENVSRQCAEDTRRMYRNLQNMTLWAYEMWDSSVKQSVGFLHGSAFQLGNFDECMEPHLKVKHQRGIKRQYCLAEVTITSTSSQRRLTEYKEEFDPYSNVLDKIYYSGDQIRRKRDRLHWAMCVPATCTPSDLETMINGHFLKTSVSNDVILRAAFNPFSCQTEKMEMDIPAGAIFFFIFFGVLLLIVMTSSIWHWCIIKNRKGNEVNCPRLVECYSLIHQLKKLGETDDETTLDVLYGIKVLSICFIITDHRMGTTLAGPISNMEYLEGVYRSFEFMFFSHGDLIVDTFLVLSGLLAIHGLMKKYHQVPKNVMFFILLRFLRLVPAYAVTLIFAAYVLPLTGSGPLWAKIHQDAVNCQENWWTNLLMINNYVHVDKMCMFHSWYIPVDFQLTVLFLCCCGLLRTFPKLAKAIGANKYRRAIVAGTILGIAVLTPGIITYVMKLPSMLLFHDDFLVDPQSHPVYQIMYIKTHARATPYVLGLITGYLIYKYNETGVQRISTLISSLGGAFALALLFLAIASGYVFYLPTKEYDPVESAIYATMYRPIWSAGICLLVVLCVFGKVPIVTNMLSWSPWKPLGKLVYGAYLVHLLIQLRALTMTRQPVFLDGFGSVGVCLGDIVYSFSLSLLLYLTVEAPTKDIINLLFYPNLRKTKSSSDSQSSETGHSNKALKEDELSEENHNKVGAVNTITGIFVMNNPIKSDTNKNIV